MIYQSSRSKEIVNASTAIVNGLSKDGGLYTPVTFEKADFLTSNSSLSYQELSKKVLEYFLNDFSVKEINEIVDQSYTSDNFPDKMVGLEQFDEFGLLTLYHGPTFAFKDMALTMFSRLHNMAKIKNNDTRKTIILSATSGDTGSAVLNGFKTDDKTEVVVFYPHGKVSLFQEKQMLAFQSKNRHVISIDGNFDDCQTLIKNGFQSIKLQNSVFSSANSINIARIIPQVIYYFYGYNELLRSKKISFGEKINFVVPTGNFGNILAGYYAKKMGLPIHKLIVSSNENNVLTDFFRTGLYNRNRDFYTTSSPSMDILVSSNLERLLFDITDHDNEVVKTKMNELNIEGHYHIDSKCLNKLSMFHSEYVTEVETINTIKKTFDALQFLIDPHTSVGVKAYEKYKMKTHDLTYSLVLSTASPIKFMSALEKTFDDLTGDFSHQVLILQQKYFFPIDPRVLKLSSESIKPILWQKESALENLKKLVGEIDV